jgi:hypothetical protein
MARPNATQREQLVCRERESATVLVMHGTVDRPVPFTFIHRNLLDQAAFAAHLASREMRYVDLVDALNGEGCALTIDDATHASADAALLARRFGHAVTIFVNPFNVVSQTPYTFSVLNALLDAASLRIGRGKLSFRRYLRLRRNIKRRLLKVPSEEGRLALLDKIAGRLGVSSLTVTREGSSIDISTLDTLARAGVRIGNHSWTHVNLACLSREGAQREIQRGREWIEARYEATSAFAVPFGDLLPPFDISDTTWLLNNSSLFSGFVGNQVLNRRTLRLAGE